MRREELYLQDIVEAVSAIELFLAGIEKTVFLESDLLQSAVLQKLSILGEASARISDELKTRHPQTPWKKIVGFRKIAVHVYFSMNWEIVWAAAIKDAPTLGKQILLIQQTEFPDSQLRNQE